VYGAPELFAADMQKVINAGEHRYDEILPNNRIMLGFNVLFAEMLLFRRIRFKPHDKISFNVETTRCQLLQNPGGRNASLRLRSRELLLIFSSTLQCQIGVIFTHGTLHSIAAFC
jgi:hypothetical protein